jgi:hypothetical protein
LEQQAKVVVADDAPTCIAYIPHNGRSDLPSGGKSFRSGLAWVVIYDPACLSKELLDIRARQQALPS